MGVIVGAAFVVAVSGRLLVAIGLFEFVAVVFEFAGFVLVVFGSGVLVQPANKSVKIKVDNKK